ncbi:hypothetical protein [Ilumatobacter nonamiensis]|uniref:hypothetical protein n=1 Tax=Ilumatobacter nonamiensis TaxID=467093 RepID=UPI00058CF620|nr:hypothetical protein [Ilumatobacter nonamiensis]
MAAAASWPEVLAAGKACKFAVVDPRSGDRSSIWRIWTGKNADDVYLLELNTGKDWKVSLHNEPGRETGEPAWRIAMTGEGAEGLGRERAVVDHWIPEAPEDGWIEGVGILIPFAYLRPPAEALSPSVLPVQVLSPALSGYCVRLFLEAPGAKAMPFPPGLPIAVFERCGGGRLYVLATPTRLEPRQIDAFELMCERARAERADVLEYPTDRFVGVARLQSQRLLIDLTIA